MSTILLNGEPIPSLIPLARVGEFFPGGKLAGLRAVDPLTQRTSPWLPKYTDASRKVLDLRSESNNGAMQYVVSASRMPSVQGVAATSQPQQQQEAAAAASQVSDTRAQPEEQQPAAPEMPPRGEAAAAALSADDVLARTRSPSPLPAVNDSTAAAATTAAANPAQLSVSGAWTPDVERRSNTLSYLRGRVVSDAAVHAGMPPGAVLPRASSNSVSGAGARSGDATSAAAASSGADLPPPARGRSLGMLGGRPAGDAAAAKVPSRTSSASRVGEHSSSQSKPAAVAADEPRRVSPPPPVSTSVTAAPSPDRILTPPPPAVTQPQQGLERLRSADFDAALPPPAPRTSTGLPRPSGLLRMSTNGGDGDDDDDDRHPSFEASANEAVAAAFRHATRHSAPDPAREPKHQHFHDDDEQDDAEDADSSEHNERAHRRSRRNSAAAPLKHAKSYNKVYAAREPTSPSQPPAKQLTPQERRKLRRWNQERWDALRLLLTGLVLLVGITIAAAERDTWTRCGLRTMTRALRGTPIGGHPSLISDEGLTAVVGTHVYFSATVGVWRSCVTASINLTEEGRLLNRWDENLRHALRTVREGTQRREDAAIFTSQTTQDWHLSDSSTVLTAVGFADALPVYQVCNENVRDHQRCQAAGDIATFVRLRVLTLLTLVPAALLMLAVIVDLNAFRFCPLKLHKYVLAVCVIFVWSLSLATWLLYAESANVPARGGMTHAECELEANLREPIAAIAAATIHVSENATRFREMLDVRTAEGRTLWNANETAILQQMQTNLSTVPRAWLARPVIYLDDCSVAFSAWAWIACWIIFTIVGGLFLYARIRAHYDDASSGGSFFNPVNVARMVINRMIGKENLFQVTKDDDETVSQSSAASPHEISRTGDASLLRTVAEHGLKMGVEMISGKLQSALAADADGGSKKVVVSAAAVARRPTSSGASSNRSNSGYSEGASEESEAAALAADCSRHDYGPRMEHATNGNGDDDDDANLHVSAQQHRRRVEQRPRWR